MSGWRKSEGRLDGKLDEGPQGQARPLKQIDNIPGKTARTSIFGSGSEFNGITDAAEHARLKQLYAPGNELVYKLRIEVLIVKFSIGNLDSWRRI